MAYYDELTQTLNRRTFIYRAEQIIARCVKNKEHLSFILFDIDHFKNFNDTFGHDAGDRILKDLSERIRQFLGSAYLIGRYGGDEFALLMYGMDKYETEKYLEQIMELVSEAEIPGVSERYTISMGVINLIPSKHTDLDSLYTFSDKALYQAKHNNRNCMCFGEIMEEQDSNQMDY
ncbi:GGDEF domain-containing protein [Bacillus rubiinfantis]|uniref:GGDEF domain-containing protein n=1 Tax=Bacillus rubiinfantis TaxID=1499680 RepID=UPI0005A71DBD|nr:GGDEF domain-containing protein [Bacillus rubiinfantis]